MNRKQAGAIFLSLVACALSAQAANYVICYQDVGAVEKCEVHDSLPTSFLAIASRDDAKVVRVWKISDREVEVRKYSDGAVGFSTHDKAFSSWGPTNDIFTAMQRLCDEFEDYQCGRRPKVNINGEPLKEGWLIWD